MLKTRQKQVRCFELEGADSQEYLKFIDKNAPLLQNYLLLFKNPIPLEVQQSLQKHELVYIFSPKELKGKASDNAMIYEALELKEQEPPKPQSPPISVQIYERHIRSGEEIDSSCNLLFLGNINHGAKIYTEQNISVYGRCEGIIICMGVYMVLKNVYSAHIVFQGKILSQTHLERINENTKLKLITKNGDIVTIKDIT
ncbi:septum site-determining protein MinC [Helicobacter ailurogastricus]|uniref:Probable septum site-determining protein minC n=1 Tax=Helicobacter ailurogastricus TaxID=1578720 RepID=A0A0K2X8N0_9HELI|nr:septum site-determining protein MinC [Helicobacter ailurogastricus]CRF40349.1 Probable septum site-determining protein minC [Helicobacter ailurogastricus]CRF42416.1 Probable septum site-determining protein minC [Helicobacter ailurogastricus]CRF44643.1 Probable septum site-determining protein minC [Helicobacter ailurogastricus]CRF52061.1 Probable septum site-determining protein minC [Helicobacter ailurogastricus]BDQ29175.1 putative septum site-determining protein MinC [Helicobacter ailurogas